MASVVLAVGAACATLHPMKPAAQVTEAESPDNSQAIGVSDAGEKREITVGEALPRDIVVFTGIGNVEFASGLNYSRSARSENLRIQRSRSLSVPVNLSIGLGSHLELSLGTGLVYGEREELLLNGTVSESDQDLDDFSLGLSWQVREDSVDAPGVSLTFSGTLPSDDNSGAITLSLDAGFSRRIDPLLLFGNVGYARAIDSYDTDGASLRDGDVIAYGFGLSFVVNSSVVLSSRFNASFGLDSSINGDTIDGSGTEPMSLSTSIGVTSGTRSRWNVSLTQGLNDEGGDVQIGVTFIRTLRDSGR